MCRKQKYSTKKRMTETKIKELKRYFNNNLNVTVRNGTKMFKISCAYTHWHKLVKIKSGKIYWHPQSLSKR